MMKLKLAIVATSAVGAVTAGGFAYATVGNSSHVDDATKKAAQAVQDAKSKLPTSAPTCLPSVPKDKVPGVPKDKLPKAKAPKAKLPKAKQHHKKPHLPSMPTSTGLPSLPGSLPKTPGVPGSLPKPSGLPTPSKPTGLPTGLPQAHKPNMASAPSAPSAPKNMPTCLPSAPSAPAGLPTSAPNLPKPQAPSCANVPALIKREGSRAKDITLPNGMRFGASHTYSITVAARSVCVNAQKWVAGGKSYLTVERLNTPPQVTLEELAAALKLPQGNVVSLNGVETWRSPLGAGMLWYSDKGYAVYLTGSPELSGQLPGIAAQLRRS